MADRLLIHYSADSHKNISWVLVNDQYQLMSAVQQGPLEEVNLPTGYKATLLLNSARVQLESVQIPTNKINRQRQAAPFALEDKLASDIEDTHFALAKKQQDDLIPVASVDRHLLNTIIETFKQAGIKIDYLLVDLLALPDESAQNGWSLLVTEKNCLIRTGAFSGQYCERENLPLVLPSLIEQSETAPEFLNVLHKEDDLELDSLFDQLQLPLRKVSWQNSVLNVFSRNLASAQQLNILQGDYTPKRESNIRLLPWRSVAAIAGTLITLQLIYAALLGNQLEDKNRQLTVQIEEQFKQANPGARKFNNMRNRMEHTLKELRSGKGSDQADFLQLLATASGALGADKKIIILAMVYRNQHIDLELQADSLQTLENLKAKLASLRNIKTVLSTSIEKDKINGRLRLEAQG